VEHRRTNCRYRPEAADSIERGGAAGGWGGGAEARSLFRVASEGSAAVTTEGRERVQTKSSRYRRVRGLLEEFGAPMILPAFQRLLYCEIFAV